MTELDTSLQDAVNAGILSTHKHHSVDGSYKADCTHSPPSSPVIGAGCPPQLIGGVKSLCTPQKLQIELNPS